MAYLSAATILEILAKVGPASLRRVLRDTILPKLKTEFDANATGLASMPAAAGTLEASKLVQVDANKHIDALNTTALSIGAAGAAVAITATPAELNQLDGTALADEFAALEGISAELTALSGMATELGLLDGLTVGSAVLNALNANPGKRALNILYVPDTDNADTDTVTIGNDIYELDTHDVSTITGGNIRVDVSSAATKSQGTLTIAEPITNGDTMTIDTKVYTFVPAGTANGEGEINNPDEATAKLNIVKSIKGEDTYTTVHPTVTCAAAFVADALVLTAKVGGVKGDLIATTETLTHASNIFDGATLGTTTAGVDPLAAAVTDALITAINASATEAVAAVDIGTTEVLLLADAVGVVALACTETFTGALSVWAAATMFGGAAASGTSVVAQTRVPTATEVTLGNMHFQFDFTVAFVEVCVRATATGVVKAWDGGLTVSTNRVTLTNAGAVDWAATDTIYVLAYA